jgi:hypothetical protein
MRLLVTLVTVIWTVILFLVGGRFIALLIGANRDSQLIDWLYRHSDYWVKPFFNVLGLTNKAVENTGGVFEPASLVAFVVYFLAGALLLNLLSGTFSGTLRHA